MNKEELLQKIKDEVAKELGFDNWGDMMEARHHDLRYVTANILDQVVERYAIAMCEEQKRQDADSAKMQLAVRNPDVIADLIDKETVDIEFDENLGSDYKIRIDRQSILQTKNVAE